MPQPKANKPIFTKIVGVSYDNPDGSSRQQIIENCRVGEELLLVREPHNRFDKSGNAVAVMRKNGEQLGYLSGERAGEIAPDMDDRRRYDVEISDLTGGPGGWFKADKTRGVNITITPYRLERKRKTED